jgi:hypothetical protein
MSKEIKSLLVPRLAWQVFATEAREIRGVGWRASFQRPLDLA